MPKQKKPMWKPSELPLGVNFETVNILKKLPEARSALAELKGVAETIPDQKILINTLALQEAKDSSAVENIITTHDELYKADLNIESFNTVAAKEVQNYAAALKHGFDLATQNLILTRNHILAIQEILESNNAGFRKVPGTALKNEGSGEVIYEPPQHPEDILRLMGNLENYINDDEIQDIDPLIKLAIIHFQFESIHPFYDGNGRTGRIINILYLIIKKLLNIPVLYLSRYINQHKAKYYEYIQAVRDEGSWENWILYMIDAVKKTALQTIEMIREIKKLMLNYKHRIRGQFKFYSQDLLNNLFRHPYTKIESVMVELGVSRPTATSYLNKLVKSNFLEKHKIGKSNYYINTPLVAIFMKEHQLPSEL